HAAGARPGSDHPPETAQDRYADPGDHATGVVVVVAGLSVPGTVLQGLRECAGPDSDTATGAGGTPLLTAGGPERSNPLGAQTENDRENPRRKGRSRRQELPSSAITSRD